MAGIDSLLRMLISNNADELRVGTGLPPKMLNHGAPVRLSIPATDHETLKHLVGDLLTPEREAALASQGRSEFVYAMGSGESFRVAFVTREPRGAEPALDVIFKRGAEATVRPVANLPPRTPPVMVPPVAVRPVAVQSPAADARLASVESRPANSRPPAAESSLHSLLAHAAELRASDLHLCDGEAPTFRVDGRLRASPDFTADSAADALAALEKHPSRSSNDHAFALAGVGRFRVNVYRTLGRRAAAIRLLPSSTPTLSQLALPSTLHELVAVPHGLVLVCGPTGSGKSATLAALAEEALRRRGGLLITLEDPVEYAIVAGGSGLVRQRQVGDDVADFSTGLRDALREDPDILLIGEMRDQETITLALTAAETGHLVLASLHSRSSASTIERIVDAYPAERQQQIRVQLADALSAVICQRLLPRASGAGRLPAVEILRGTHGVASLIRDGKSAQLTSAIQSSRKEGMIPLERSLADLVRGGQITREVASAAANEPQALLTYLQ